MINLEEFCKMAYTNNKNFAVAVSVMVDDDIPEEHFTYRPATYPKSDYQRNRGVPLFVKYAKCEVTEIGYDEMRNKFIVKVQMPFEERYDVETNNDFDTYYVKECY